MKIAYKYIYGPVSSWRLGVSLGIVPGTIYQKIYRCNYIYFKYGGPLY